MIIDIKPLSLLRGQCADMPRGAAMPRLPLQLFKNINRDVSALVKFATRSGFEFYVGKIGDCDNVIRNVIIRVREVKSFNDIHKSCHSGCP